MRYKYETTREVITTDWIAFDVSKSVGGSLSTPDWDPNSLLVGSASQDANGITLELTDTSAVSAIQDGVGWAISIKDIIGRTVDFSSGLFFSVAMKLTAPTAPTTSDDIWAVFGIGDNADPGSSNAGGGGGFHWTGGGAAADIRGFRINPDLYQDSTLLSGYDDSAAGSCIIAPGLAASKSKMHRFVTCGYNSSGAYYTGHNQGYAITFSADMDGTPYVYAGFGRSVTGGGNVTAKFQIEYQMSLYKTL